MLFKQKDEQTTSLKNRLLFESVILSQKGLAEGYSKSSFECTGETLRDDILNIMREEQTIYYTLSDEMSRRGWKKEDAADLSEKSAALQNFKNIKNTL